LFAQSLVSLNGLDKTFNHRFHIRFHGRARERSAEGNLSASSMANIQSARLRNVMLLTLH
jgi:hypothetical protein